MLGFTGRFNWSAKWCLIFVLSLPVTALAHPIKLTASLVEYDPKAKTLRMECNVFIDDFEWSLAFSVLRERGISKLTEANRPGIIEEYFKNSYVIEVNGKKLPLKYASSETFTKENVLLLKFENIPIDLSKGDEISIKNTLFFQDFSYMQTNHVLVRIPPFIDNKRHMAVLDEDSFSYRL